MCMELEVASGRWVQSCPIDSCKWSVGGCVSSGHSLGIRVFVLRRILLLLREERHGLAIYEANSLQDVIDG